MIKQFYIYLHRRPDTGAVFYVGRGKSYHRGTPVKRAYVTADRSKSWNSVVAKNGGNYSVEILEWLDTFDEAKEREVALIKSFGLKRDGGTLVNQTYGGDGIDGYKHSDESRQKLKAAWAKTPERKSHLQSETFLAARRAAVAGLPGAMTGRKHTEQTIEAYRKARAGRKNSQARRVVNKGTGERFGCVAEAAKSIGLSRYTLYNYLAGHRKNTTPLEYA